MGPGTPREPSGPSPEGEEPTPPEARPTPHPTDGTPFWNRLYGALTLDAHVFEEVEHDREAMGQAALVVGLGAIAEFIGLGHASAIFTAFVGWLVATAVIWIIGVRILEHTSDFSELLRTIGFATAPKILLAFGLLLPGPLAPFRWLLSIFVVFLVTVAFIVAVRQALDVKTGRAVFICLVGVIANMIPSLLLGRAAWIV